MFNYLSKANSESGLNIEGSSSDAIAESLISYMISDDYQCDEIDEHFDNSAYEDDEIDFWLTSAIANTLIGINNEAECLSLVLKKVTTSNALQNAIPDIMRIITEALKNAIFKIIDEEDTDIPITSFTVPRAVERLVCFSSIDKGNRLIPHLAGILITGIMPASSLSPRAGKIPPSAIMHSISKMHSAGIAPLFPMNQRPISNGPQEEWYWPDFDCFYDPKSFIEPLFYLKCYQRLYLHNLHEIIDYLSFYKAGLKGSLLLLSYMAMRIPTSAFESAEFDNDPAAALIPYISNFMRDTREDIRVFATTLRTGQEWF